MATGSIFASPSRGTSWEPYGSRQPRRPWANGAADRSSRRGSVVRVAIVEPHELLVAGWERLLSDTPTSRYQVAAGDSREPADITLYGVRPDDRAGCHDPDLHALLRSTRSTVVVTHWGDTPAAVEAALRCGARGALSRGLPQAGLLAGIERILRNADPRLCPTADASCHPEVARAGLSPRELEVLCLVARGLTNQEIAERLYLSINTVKTYIRCGYRKVGAERRSHAVIWVQRHGLTSSAGADVMTGTTAVPVERPVPRAPGRMP